MKIHKILLWILPVLILGITIPVVVLGSIQKLGIQSGWRYLHENNSKLLSNNIWSITIDHKGRTWIMTSHGMSIYDGEKWIDNLDEYYGFVKLSIVTFDERGWLWRWDGLNRAHGIDIYDGESWQHLSQENSGLSDDQVTAIAFDQEDRAWIGTEEGGINVYDGENWIYFNQENSGFPKEYVGNIAFDNQGRAWVTQHPGISVFDEGEWEHYSYDFYNQISS